MTNLNDSNVRFTLLYFPDHHRTLDELTDALMYAYDTLPQNATDIVPLKLALAQPPPRLIFEARPAIMRKKYPRQCYLQ